MKTKSIFTLLAAVLAGTISFAQKAQNPNPYAIFGGSPYVIGAESGQEQAKAFVIENLAEGSEVVRLEHNPQTGLVKFFDATNNLIAERLVTPGERAWPTPDPKAEKYYSISPYAYALNNPVRYIDPNGQDVWEVDPDGNITQRIKDKTQDAFFMVDANGQRMEGDQYSISFAYGTVRNVMERSVVDPSGTAHNFTMFDIAGDGNAQQLFEIMSNNPNSVEWSHSKVGAEGSGRNIVGTSHLVGGDGTGSYLENQGYTIREHTHSHPYSRNPSGADMRYASPGINNYIYYNNGYAEPQYMRYDSNGLIFHGTTTYNNGAATVDFHAKQRMTPWQRRHP